MGRMHALQPLLGDNGGDGALVRAKDELEGGKKGYEGRGVKGCEEACWGWRLGLQVTSKAEGREAVRARCSSALLRVLLEVDEEAEYVDGTAECVEETVDLVWLIRELAVVIEFKSCAPAEATQTHPLQPTTCHYPYPPGPPSSHSRPDSKPTQTSRPTPFLKEAPTAQAKGKKNHGERGDERHDCVHGVFVCMLEAIAEAGAPAYRVSSSAHTALIHIPLTTYPPLRKSASTIQRCQTTSVRYPSGY
ncbi:hypothetical protein BV22DRAFT_1050595 [Leucogyrophana mollusca]|uniref:Uncharacterized protein n=1 Tax=Leucogyrophana mollusca TaxID=85980 RepID=A0ACB8B2U5_9AGAM|nr:hypothetical protein BV22DRAFT_1050595 [Leucogyrophana mollusca]